MRMFALAFVGLLVGCKTTTPDANTEDSAENAPAVPFSDCDPLSPTVCGFPFPSQFYMVEDDDTPTGWRVNLGPTTLPSNSRGQQPEPTFWNERDGWSVGGPIMVHMPTATVAGVAGHDDIAGSLADGSRTLLLDLDTGERVAHFAERDVRLTDSEDSVFLIRPVAPLEFGHTYVVGLRGIVDSDGDLVPATDAFVALRDGTATDDTDIEGRRDWYDDLIFPSLLGEGWARDDVQVAWHFVTGSRQGITGQAVSARDQALAAVADGIVYTIDEVEDAPDENTAYRLKGTVTVPLFTDVDAPGAVLTRGADGLPVQNGTTDVAFTVVVSRSLVDEARSGPLVQYGHGLLGGQGEVHAGYLAEMADDNGWVIFAVDWTGMKTADAPMIAVTIQNDMGRIAIVPERSIQGFVEFAVAMEMMGREMLDEPLMMVEDPDGAGMISLVDPTRRFYYGNSQGGIMGGAYTGLSTHVQRSVLGVAGGPYSLLLTRSSDFDAFLGIIELNFPDAKDTSLWLGLVQTLWDSAESVAYLRSTTADPLPGTSTKDVLLQIAMADKQVTPLGAHVMARGYGASLIEPAARQPWGLDEVASGYAGSAIVEFDYGIEVPYENVPPEGDDPHEWPRRDAAGQQQIATFFETGTVVNYCEGVCGDPDRSDR